MRAIRIPESRDADLSPVLAHLAALQARLETPAAPPRPLVREGSRNLLTHPGPRQTRRSHADQGRGEGPRAHAAQGRSVLLLADRASGRRRMCEHIDEQLASFKGRIERDHWIDQASELAAQPEPRRRRRHRALIRTAPSPLPPVPVRSLYNESHDADANPP